MAVSDSPTYHFMNGWDLIAGTKQKRVNESLQRFPAIPVSVTRKIDVFGIPVDGKIDILIRPPTIYVKDVSGRQVDVIFPISGTITIGSAIILLPDKPKPQSLIATVQLTQIEAELQDKKGEKKTRYDFILDLKSKDLIVDLKYEGVNEGELAVLIVALKKVLQEEVANHQKFKVASFYLNNDVADPLKPFIPRIADFTFVRDNQNPENSNLLVLMLTKTLKRGGIFFNAPILPDDENFILMVNNHLFLDELVYPKLIESVKKEAKNKNDVKNEIVISPNDATKELWTIHNTRNIDLDKDHDPWISTIQCHVDESVDQLLMYLDVKADATFIKVHVDTWVRTWLQMQNNSGSLSINKAKEESGHSTDVEWWKYIIGAIPGAIVVAIIKSIVDQHVTDLAGKFDSVATVNVEWPFQKTVVIKDILSPGHIVFTLDLQL